MSATYDEPPGLPNPYHWRAGQKIASAPFDTLAGAANYALAYAGTGEAFQMRFDGTIASFTGVLSGVVQTRAVRIVSDAHTTLRCYARLSHAGAAGFVRFSSVTAGDSVDVAAPAAVALVGPVDLTIADNGSGYEEVEIRFGATVGTPTVVEHIFATIAPLATPLTALVGAAAPVGRDIAGADYPCSSALGHAIIAAFDQAADAPRGLLNWAMTDNVDGPDLLYPAHGVEAYNPDAFRGRANEYTVLLYTTGKANAADLYVDDQRYSVEVPALGGTAWRSFTDSHARVDGSIETGDLQYRMRPSEVRNVTTLEAPTTTEVGLESIAVFGP